MESPNEPEPANDDDHGPAIACTDAQLPDLLWSEYDGVRQHVQSRAAYRSIDVKGISKDPVMAGTDDRKSTGLQPFDILKRAVDETLRRQQALSALIGRFTDLVPSNAKMRNASFLSRPTVVKLLCEKLDSLMTDEMLFSTQDVNRLSADKIKELWETASGGTRRLLCLSTARNIRQRRAARSAIGLWLHQRVPFRLTCGVKPKFSVDNDHLYAIHRVTRLLSTVCGLSFDSMRHQAGRDWVEFHCLLESDGCTKEEQTTLATVHKPGTGRHLMVFGPTKSAQERVAHVLENFLVLLGCYTPETIMYRQNVLTLQERSRPTAEEIATLRIDHRDPPLHLPDKLKEGRWFGHSYDCSEHKPMTMELSTATKTNFMQKSEVLDSSGSETRLETHTSQTATTRRGESTTIKIQGRRWMIKEDDPGYFAHLQMTLALVVHPEELVKQIFGFLPRDGSTEPPVQMHWNTHTGNLEWRTAGDTHKFKGSVYCDGSHKGNIIFGFWEAVNADEESNYDCDAGRHGTILLYHESLIDIGRTPTVDPSLRGLPFAVSASAGVEDDKTSDKTAGVEADQTSDKTAGVEDHKTSDIKTEAEKEQEDAYSHFRLRAANMRVRDDYVKAHAGQLQPGDLVVFRAGKLYSAGPIRGSTFTEVVQSLPVVANHERDVFFIHQHS